MKTLKDLNVPLKKKTKEGVQILSAGIDSSQMEYLRQEAIKWIKELNLEIQRIRESPHAIERPDLEIEIWKKIGMVEWIKHFFNITNKDLK